MYSFYDTPDKMIHWFCCMEEYPESGGSYFQLTLKLNRNKRWLSSKIFLLERCYGGPQLSHQYKLLTSRTNYSHQEQITHMKYKLLRSKTNYSHQIQIAHIKYKILTSSTNYAHKKQIAHIKFKLLTSNTNCSHQKQD